MESPVPSQPAIILVDDDIALRTALSFSLELDGFAVDARPDGESLLAHPLPATGACLVVDLNLPGLSGLEALQQLRARGVDLPAILITSYPTPAVREEARSSRISIIEKPLLGDHLVAAIHEALQTG